MLMYQNMCPDDCMTMSLKKFGSTVLYVLQLFTTFQNVWFTCVCNLDDDTSFWALNISSSFFTQAGESAAKNLFY
jgi:hypothetical protein